MPSALSLVRIPLRTRCSRTYRGTWLPRVRDSKAAIEERLGEAITAFAYPYAFPQADKRWVARIVGPRSGGRVPVQRDHLDWPGAPFRQSLPAEEASSQ